MIKRLTAFSFVCFALPSLAIGPISKSITDDVNDTAYNATTWNGDTLNAPSKNAVRDKIETLSGGATLYYTESAVGDDTANDTAALQAAMDAVPARGTLFLRALTFKITAALTRTDGQGPIRILGAGGEYGSTIIHQATANTDALTISVVENATLAEQDNASSIEHVMIKGPSGNTSGNAITTSASIHLDYVTTEKFHDGLALGAGVYYSHVANSTFRLASRAGVRGTANYQHNQIFDKCRFDTNAYGLYFAGDGQIARFSMTHCAVERNTVNGAYLDNVKAAYIGQTFFETPEDNADDIILGPTNPTNNVTIESCWFTAHPDAENTWHVNADNVQGLRIVGCTMNGNCILATDNTSPIDLGGTFYQTISGVHSIEQNVAKSVWNGGSASITFTVPSGTKFTNLRISVKGRTATAADGDNIMVRFNGDTGTNYDWVNNNSGGITATTGQTGIYGGSISGASAAANVAAGGTIWVEGYNDALFKTAHSQFANTSVGTQKTDLNGGLWRNTAPITTVTVYTGSGASFTGQVTLVAE